jgi:deazaflavin-dependent oxidoreductase (nitroreductase family)
MPVAGERAGRLRPSTEREYRLVKPVIRLMSLGNTWVFRATGGRLGSRFLRGAPVGLLTTTGRKSGRRRTTPLIYLEDGGRIVLVASQGGLPHHPVWFLNLQADPAVWFQIGSEPRAFRARRAGEAEKRGLWPRLCAVYPDYDDYQRRTDREIPVVILEPVPA